MDCGCKIPACPTERKRLGLPSMIDIQNYTTCRNSHTNNNYGSGSLNSFLCAITIHQSTPLSFSLFILPPPPQPYTVCTAQYTIHIMGRFKTHIITCRNGRVGQDVFVQDLCLYVDLLKSKQSWVTERKPISYQPKILSRKNVGFCSFMFALGLSIICGFTYVLHKVHRCIH